MKGIEVLLDKSHIKSQFHPQTQKLVLLCKLLK